MCEVEVAGLEDSVNEVKVLMGILKYSIENGDKSIESQLILKVVDDDKLGEVNQDVKEEW